LGLALAERVGLGYSELLKLEVTEPLDLKDTVVTLSQDQLTRFVPGHDRERHEVHAWDLNAMVGAGGIRSTAGDMLSYLEAQLHPDKLSTKNGPDETLKAALESSHELRADTGQPTSRIALAWMFATDSQTYSHGGGTAGFSGFVLFNSKGDYAVVVLANVGASFAELVAEHIVQRLEGKPAISLPD
jgi:CubicO group peptidase (beta-lactamase class C family)